MTDKKVMETAKQKMQGVANISILYKLQLIRPL